MRGVGFEVELVADGRSAQERLTNGATPIPDFAGYAPPLYFRRRPAYQYYQKGSALCETIVIITTADARMGEAYTEQVDFVMIKPISFVQLRDLTSRLKPKEQ